MDIIVCVKQVPGSSNVEVDPVTGVLKRDGTDVKLNPYDLFAIETALRIKGERGGKVKSLSMGPPQAASSLLETIYMGADEAYLLSDRVFAGADVQATSYALKCGVGQCGGYDLIICGKQTTDGDTAQVGPELAEQLGIDHAANVISVDEIGEDYITVTISLDRVWQTQKMALPCLITVEKDSCTPRLPSFKRKTETDPDSVKVFTAASIPDLDVSRCGLKGSPTQVERIFPPPSGDGREMFEGSGDELADRLFGVLKKKKYV